MNSIAQRLATVRLRIAAAEREAGRPAGSVRLIAVSKTHPAAAIREAYAAGQVDFGENYLQEGLAKQADLTDLPLVWHFIGPIQSNKTRPIAEHFDWVHSVDRLKVAERLSAQRPDGLPPLNLLIQLNVSGEDSKSGTTPEALPELVMAIGELPRVLLRGLMAIPAPEDDPDRQALAFRRVRLALEQLDRPALDCLSMGMSDDLEAAIAEGATEVRIGTAIFGKRPAKAAADADPALAR